MIEGLAVALTLGTMWFWIVTLVMFCVIGALAENEYDIWAVIAIGIFIWAMEFLGVFALFTDPLRLFAWVVGYFVIGSCYSFIKWFSLLYQKKDQLMELKRKWLATWNDQNPNHLFTMDSVLPDQLPLTSDTDDPHNQPDFVYPWANFANYVYKKGYHPNKPGTCERYGSGTEVKSRDDLIPDWNEWKKSLIRWIAWWPTSAIWTLLNDPIRRIATYLYNRYQGIYARMTAAVFSKMKV